jgi:hypothetical protein
MHYYEGNPRGVLKDYFGGRSVFRIFSIIAEGVGGVEPNPRGKRGMTVLWKILSFHSVIGNQSHINKTQWMRTIKYSEEMCCWQYENGYLKFEPHDFLGSRCCVLFRRVVGWCVLWVLLGVNSRTHNSADEILKSWELKLLNCITYWCLCKIWL